MGRALRVGFSVFVVLLFLALIIRSVSSIMGFPSRQERSDKDDVSVDVGETKTGALSEEQPLVGQHGSSMQSMNNILRKKLDSYKRFIEKVNNGDSVTILYFGGSITAGAGTYPASGIGMDGKKYEEIYYPRLHSWRELSFKWLRDTYEKYSGQFTQVNAAIGGTGSHFGVVRLEEDVLKYDPDLIFIEFAVNDNGYAVLTENDPHNWQSIYRSLLNIVSRIREANPDIAIFMPLSTYRLGVAPSYAPWLSYMQKSAELTELFCIAYEIPYVSIYDAYYSDFLGFPIETDKLFQGPDEPQNTVHPARYGHEIYAKAVCKVLEHSFSTFTFDFNVKSGDVIEKILEVEPLQWSPELISVDELLPGISGGSYEIRTIEEGGEHSPINGRKYLHITDRNVSIRYQFKGSMVGAWIDPNSACIIDIIVDGERLGSWTHNAEVQGEFGTVQYVIFTTDLDPDVEHTLAMIPRQNQQLKNDREFYWGLRALFTSE